MIICNTLTRSVKNKLSNVNNVDVLFSFHIFRMQAKLGLTLLCFGLCFSSTAIGNLIPSSFLQNQSRIIDVSYNQWLCKELRESNKVHFDSKHSDPRNNERIALLKPGITWAVPMNPLMESQFEALYFPDDDCKVFLSLKSLCDLYFPLFEKKLESNQVKKHYKYLPLVLSGMNPNYSDGSQRAGMWAMDYLTARSVHLKSDSLVDERRGGDFTADAASKYLSFLTKKFENDDAKILIAYRFGVGYTHQLIKEHGKDWLNALRIEELQFLQFFEFTIRLFESMPTSNQLKNYFDILGQYENHFFKEDVQYAALVDVLKLDEKVLRELNPVYTGQWISSSSRKVPFILELESSGRFKLLEDSIYKWTPPKPLIAEAPKVQSQFHKVKKGETLGGIASKYNVSISQLKKWNKLKGTTIHPGQKLKVRQTVIVEEPREIQTTAKSDPGKPSSASQDSTAKTEPKPIIKEPSVEKPKTEKKKDYTTYTVKSGDTLWKIASKYKGVSPEEIMKWNKCGAKIRPGQKLKIYKS
jgi:membrane-bound lytic murein transglycosylase D